MNMNLKKAAVALFLVLIAVLSFLLFSGKAMDPDTYKDTMASIDDRVDTVLKLTATSTLASAGVSAIPGDTATPIAEKLADFTEYFLLILCVLYAEKYLLTIIGAATFRILIPVACVLLSIGLFFNPKLMNKLAVKMLVFALAISVIVPLSLRISEMIYDTYNDSIEATISEAQDFTDDTSGLTQTEDEGLISAILNKLSETASSLADRAARVLNNYVESLAVMIVTSCIIPILVLVFFIWLVKILTGIEITVPGPRRKKNSPPPPEAPAEA